MSKMRAALVLLLAGAAVGVCRAQVYAGMIPWSSWDYMVIGSDPFSQVMGSYVRSTSINGPVMSPTTPIASMGKRYIAPTVAGKYRFTVAYLGTGAGLTTGPVKFRIAGAGIAAPSDRNIAVCGGANCYQVWELTLLQSLAGISVEIIQDASLGSPASWHIALEEMGFFWAYVGATHG